MEKNKNLNIPSLIPNLPKNDNSYSDLKKIIDKSIITIDMKAKKIHNIKDEKKIRENYNILKNLTDYDDVHNQLLNREQKYTKYCRYSDICTYKYNHVELKSKRYINASYIDFPSEKFFIATQGPLPKTVNDFWDMVWEKNVEYIVMLCELIEGGRQKCSEYWNQELNDKYNIKIEEKEEIGY